MIITEMLKLLSIVCCMAHSDTYCQTSTLSVVSPAAYHIRALLDHIRVLFVGRAPGRYSLLKLMTLPFSPAP